MVDCQVGIDRDGVERSGQSGVWQVAERWPSEGEMANGSLSGSVMVRPVRLGLLVEANGEELQHAVECATSSWGGIYTPFFDPGNRENVLRGANALGFDAIYTDKDESASRETADTTGYQWLGRAARVGRKSSKSPWPLIRQLHDERFGADRDGT